MTPEEKEVLDQLRQEADKKYKRRLKVLARRCGMERAKLWRILNGEQSARLPELLTLCTALSVPLSQVLRAAGA